MNKTIVQTEEENTTLKEDKLRKSQQDEVKSSQKIMGRLLDTNPKAFVDIFDWAKDELEESQYVPVEFYQLLSDYPPLIVCWI